MINQKIKLFNKDQQRTILKKLKPYQNHNKSLKKMTLKLTK